MKYFKLRSVSKQSIPTDNLIEKEYFYLDTPNIIC